MPLHKSNTQSTPQQPQQPQQPPQQTPPQPQNYRQNTNSQSQGNHSMTRSTTNINSDFRRNISRNHASENTLEFVKEVKELYRANNLNQDNSNIRVTLVDNNISNTPMSMVIISQSTSDVKGVVKIPYFIFVMESSDSHFERGNRYQNNPVGNGRQVRTVITASDYFASSTEMKNQALRHIENFYGVNTADYVKVGHMVVPSEIKPSDNVNQLRMMIFSANTAIENFINLVKVTEDPFTIDYVNKSNNNLHANIVFSKGDQKLTMTGLPSRTDISIALRGEPVNNNNGFLPDMVGNEPLTFVGGYMDLVYSKPNYPQMPPQYPHQHNPFDKVTYLPRFIITRLDTEIDAITLELQLLGLVTSLMLVDASSGGIPWVEAFRPDPNVSGVDFTDIGAVGYEVDIMDDGVPRPVETKSSEFQNREYALDHLVQRVMKMDPLISMDVEESGDLSWMNKVFVRAADDSDAQDQQKARQELFNAADNLTDGEFSKTGYNGPYARLDGNLIHIGYYHDSEGHLRDIRDVDYLAVLNVVGREGNLEPLVHFSESFEPTMPLMFRLDQRFEEISKVLGYEPRVKDWARRINFDPDFLKALLAACQKANLNIHNENTRFVHNTPRGQHGLDNYAFNMSNTGVFTNGFSQSPMGGNFYSHYGNMNNGGYNPNGGWSY